MGPQQNDNDNENIYYVALDKAGKQSFGLCVLSGQVRDAPNSKTSGIFIKGIVPDSPADKTEKLKVGDRVLAINEKDVRYATEHTVIALIKEAGTKITMKCERQSEKFANNRFTDLKSQFENKANNSESGTSNQQEADENNANGNDGKEKSFSGLSFKQPHRATLIPRHSVRRQNFDDDDDDEDTRDMTGRFYNSEGYEIDRASAANFKLTKADREKDKDEPDVFGYTMMKIRKRYVNMKSIMKVEFKRPPNTEIGIALSGHRDRQKMASFIAGIHPFGIVAKEKVDLCKGDEIIEVNGHVLQNRCHLNATVVINNLPGEKIVFLINRPSTQGKDYPIAIPEVKHHAPFFNETSELFNQYKEAKLVQIVKIESIGIMIIEGKHKEIGSGIFISDIQEDSGAQQAGLIVGDVILAVNKDVLIKANYDFAHGILKRAQGVVNLIVVSLKGGMEKEGKADGKEKEKVKEPEKPADPTKDPVKINKKTLVDIKMDKKPAGIVLAGGYGSLTRIGVFISYIHPDGVFGKDGRLQVFDQIMEVAGTALPYKEMTHHVLHQRFCVPMEKIVMAIYRADPPETETVTVEFTRKAGKELGISVMCNEKGAVISNIILGLYPDLDGKVGRGDIIRKINNDELENLELVQVYALFQKAVGKVLLEIIRPQPEKERRE